MSCTNETESDLFSGIPLQLNVKTTSIETRGLIESATLPDGHSIGLTLIDASGTTYDNIGYNNIKATASTGTTPQTWELVNAVNLSSTDGTLYGYYPYNSSVTDITQIPVMAGDTDYMYATPVEKLNDGNYNATVIMNHALATIRLNIIRGTYTDVGKVTKLTLNSKCIATSGTLNAKTGNLSNLAGASSDLGKNVSFDISTTPTVIDLAFLPVEGLSTGSLNQILISAIIDGTEYTAYSYIMNYYSGYIYTYNLTVNNKGISLSNVNIGDWGYTHSGLPVITNGNYTITCSGDISNIAFSNTVSGDGTVTIVAVPLVSDLSVGEVTCTEGATLTQSVDGNGVRTIVLTGQTSDVTLTFTGLQ